MIPSPKGPVGILLFFLLCMPPAVFTQILEPPQPRYDEYLLPPAPPPQIIEYPIILSREALPKNKEMLSEKTVPPLPPLQKKPAEAAVPESPTRETREPVPGSMKPPVPEKELDDLSPEILARLNDRFSLALEGGSWLFIEAYPTGGIVYNGRAREEFFMRFNFRATKTGKYILQFVQGSSGGGRSESRRVTVEVLPADEFLARVTGQSAAPREDEESPGTPGEDSEDDLSREERYQIGLDYLSQGAWENAFTVLTDSAEFDPAEPSMNTAAVFAAALLMEEYLIALDYASFPPSRQRDFAVSIISVGESLPVNTRRALWWETSQLLPGFHGIDGLVRALARDYEAPGENRDMEQAVRCYRYLLSEYPLSIYWDEADSRANYLERHFLLVR